MLSASAAKRRAGRVVNRLLATVGLQLVKQPEPVVPRSIFVPSGSCQIGELAQLYDLTFGSLRDGKVVEVGAFDGESFSNSSCVIAVGWSALLIEPVPEFAERCRVRYAGNERVTVAQVAVGSVESSLELKVAGPLTTGDVAQMAEYAGVEWAKLAFDEPRSVTVTSRTLDALLAEHGIAPGFELLIVDVEGMEAEVLRGFDVAHWRPVMMIWELTDTHPDLRLRRADALRVAAAIVARGYRVAYKDAINTVFVRADHMTAQA